MSFEDDLRSERFERINDVPDELVSATQKASKRLSDAFIKAASELDAKGGEIALSNKNYALADTIIDDLKKSLFEGLYGKALKDYAAEFPKQAKIADAYFKEVFDNFKPKEIYQESLKRAQLEAIKLLDAAAVEQVVAIPLKSQLKAAIDSGASIGDTVRTITNFIEGNSEAEGILIRHVKTQAKTGFSVFDRSYSNIIAKDLGVEWYYYQGGRIKDTREFCAARVGKYFHKKEIEAMAKLEWSGKMKGTNEATIFANAGGWNCGHGFVPVAISRVPADVIERNIKAGNYKP